MYRIALLLLICLSFGSCMFQKSNKHYYSWQELQGHKIAVVQEKDKFSTEPVYRVRAPLSWEKVAIATEPGVLDHTRPLCEYKIKGDGGEVTVTLHQYYYSNPRLRPSPFARIQRIQRLFSYLDPTETYVIPLEHREFTGYFFKGSGLYRDKRETTILTWAMQMQAGIYEKVTQEHQGQELKTSDYMIEARGPTSLVNKHSQQIVDFAKSFHLIGFPTQL